MAVGIDHASRSAVFTIRQWGVITAAYGLFSVIGGPQRWGGPAFRMLNFVPCQPYTTGVLMFIGGVGVIVGSITGDRTGSDQMYRLRNVAMKTCSYLCFALAAAFLAAGLFYPDAPLGGWVFIAGVGLQFRVLARLRSRMPPRDASTG